MHIRDINNTDIAALTDLHFYMWNDFYADFLPREYSEVTYHHDYCRSLQEKLVHNCTAVLDDHAAWVAVDAAGKIQALCYVGRHMRDGSDLHVEGADAELNRLYLWPQARGQGLGTALLKKAQGWCQTRGMKTLFAWSFDLNPYARFYPKHAATPLRQIMRPYAGQPLALTAWGWRL